MRCFIIREYDVATEIIRSVDEVLNELNIERIDAFFQDANKSIEINLVNIIKKADFVLAIINHDSPNVLFEIGLAVGTNKPVFLLIDENIGLPFDLIGMTYIKINSKLKDNIKLPLTHFIESLHKKREYEHCYNKATRIDIDEKEFFEELQVIKDSGNGIQFEIFVIDFFKHIEDQYTTSMFVNTSRDMAYDFAIWIDELDGKIINPVVFNLKFGQMNLGWINNIATREIESVRCGQTAIILYCDTHNQDTIFENKYPGVMFIRFEDFVHAIFKYGLPKAILLFRNCISHGREPKYDSL